MKFLTVWIIVYILNPQAAWQPNPKELRFANKEDCEQFRKIEQARFAEHLNNAGNSWLSKNPDLFYKASCEQVKIAE